MGEARRKKLAGWVPAFVRLECFVAQSMVSDAHSVYLGIGRGQEVDLRRMDSFASIVDAWESLCQSKKIWLFRTCYAKLLVSSASELAIRGFRALAGG
jgi:hypothetical protein